MYVCVLYSKCGPMKTLETSQSHLLEWIQNGHMLFIINL